MEELVIKSEKGTPVTTSLLVAQKFGKEHKHVLEVIRTLAENSADLPKIKNMFYEALLPDSYGRMQPLFVMNRDGFSLLVMGFTGKEALRFKLDFIEAFNRMESIIKNGQHQVPCSFREALLLAAQQQEQIETQQKQLALQAPKVALMNKILDTDQKIDIGQASKILSLPFGRNTLFANLREKGVFFKNRNEPKQEYIERGYFELKEKWIDREHHDGFMIVKVLVTQKGLDFIARLFEVVPSKKQLMKIA
ncbi:MAG: phage regulatory protein/antirepressor Ant [Dysgonamonadaceae bacterium]|jgi:anti-repressor protein|nr:phage regulatory protein/antirepressor Ant [Dysgonamonadaceae bacterium]